MYAINPFLFWVSVKAPVIFLIAEGWGIKDEEEFFLGITWFSGETEEASVVINRVQRGFFFIEN